MSVTLDGIELEADQDLGWAFPPGPDPYRRTFEVSPGQAEALMQGAKPRGSVLRFALPGHDLVECHGLTIRRVSPGSHPDIVLIHVEDARGTWRDPHVYRRYNVRATTGNYVRVGDLDAPLAVKQLSPREAYKAWSIDGERPFSFVRLLHSVLDELEGVGGWVDETKSGVGNAPGVDVADVASEDGLLDDSGTGAMRRLLGSVGALDVHVGYDGRIRLRNRLDDGERALVGAPGGQSTGTKVRGDSPGIGPQVAGEPLWLLQDRRLERPAGYLVQFDREIELRLDFAGDEVEPQSGDQADPPIRTRNVLAVPDETLVMADGRTVVQGTWVPIEDYLVAKRGSWGLTPSGAALPDLSLEIVRQTFLCPGAFNAYCDPTIDQGGVNQRAVQAILGAYRTTFQIDKVWTDRLAWWRQNLVSIVDPQRATFADSPVYSDWCEWLTWRATWQEQQDGDPITRTLLRNRYATGSEAVEILDSTIGTLKRAPAMLVPLDVDAGVFALRYRMDATGQQNMVVPSALDPDSQPSTDPSDRNIYAQWAALRPLHQVSVIVTVGMGAPNDGRVLHTVGIDPRGTKIAQRLGRVDVGPCEGPVRTLRVNAGSGIAARFAWQDAAEQNIRALFSGLTGDQTGALEALLVNRDDVLETAMAAVANDLSVLLDHVEGSHVTYMTPAEPRGTATIEHRLSQGESGGALTAVVCPPDPPRVDMTVLLPDAVRKRNLAQLGAVQAGGGA